MTSAQIAGLNKQIRERLSAARKAVGDRGFEWYPYDSLANISNLERLFGGRYLSLLDSAAGKQVADIGCGDGDLAFFLESLGCKVDAIDFEASNHNGMQAIRMLKQHLASGIEIANVDLDSQFKLPRSNYDLAVFLGILYHLKNPLYVMERLAMQTRYCVLSTRVARYFPDDKPMPQGQPIAYLLGEDELNRDDSNFWIFSHAGLKRLIERAHWKILEYASLGDTHLSTPVDSKRDERVFCLLESHYSLANVELLHGWHNPEIGGTRWTRKQFAARINLTGLAGPDRIRMRIYMPEGLVPRRLDIAIDGVPATPAILDKSGYHDVVRRFRPQGKRSIVASFQVDKALPPDKDDDRERGIVVVSLDGE
jgi:tRNA (mo5U34)-methyltransferase